MRGEQNGNREQPTSIHTSLTRTHTHTAKWISLNILCICVYGNLIKLMSQSRGSRDNGEWWCIMWYAWHRWRRYGLWNMQSIMCSIVHVWCGRLSTWKKNTEREEEIVFPLQYTYDFCMSSVVVCRLCAANQFVFVQRGCLFHGKN